MIERPWHRPDCRCPECLPPPVEPTLRQCGVILALFLLTAVILYLF